MKEASVNEVKEVDSTSADAKVAASEKDSNMRRSEIIRSVKAVIDALELCHVREALDQVSQRHSRSGEEGRPRRGSTVLGALNQFSILASRFTGAEREILRIFSLTPLLDVDLWPNFSEPTQPAMELRQAVMVTTRLIPQVLELLTQDYQQPASRDKGKAGPRFPTKQILSVIILEEKEHYSSSKRVVEVLEAVSLLYQSCAVIRGEKSDQQLVLLACDSGSDKSFDFLGVAKVVECVKEVILSLWDRVVFYREHKLGERLDLVAKSLPILDTVGTLQSQGKLGPEQAEILRRDIISGVEKFISCGAIIPEIESNTQFNPRQLMAPEPKLLGPPPPEGKMETVVEVSPPTAGEGQEAAPPQRKGPSKRRKRQNAAMESQEPALQGLNAEEQAQVSEILRKAKARKGGPPDDQTPDPGAA